MRSTTEQWLQKIAELAVALNERTNHVNAQLEEIEDYLTRVGVGVDTRNRDVRVDVDGVTWALGYCRVNTAAGNAYRLAAWLRGEPGSTDAEPRVLLNCPRAVRVAALDVIDSVLFAILQRQKDLLEKTEAVPS